MMPQVGIFPWSQPMPHDHSVIGQGGLIDPSVVDHDALLNFLANEHLTLANTIAQVLSDHNKANHDALAINADQVDGEEAANIVTGARVNPVITKAAIDALAVNAGQVDGVEGAEIIQRDGSVPLTAAWDAGGFSMRAVVFIADAGGVILLGNSVDRLRLAYDADEIAKIVGVSNNIAGLKISDAIISGKAQLTAPTELTIAANAITVTKSYHTVDGQGDVADDLDTINGGVDGMILVLGCEAAARAITIKHNVDNIRIQGAADMVLDLVTKKALCFYDATSTIWLVLPFYG